MGHAGIATMLGDYTYYKYEDVEKEVKELETRKAGIIGELDFTSGYVRKKSFT